MEERGSILSFLNRFVPISQEEYRELVEPYTTIRKFDRKTIINRPGEVENYFNFIIKGLVRKYYKKGREEINTQISLEGQIIHSQESFHSRQPSEYFIETLEPTEFLSVSYDNLERVYASSQKFERMGRLVITYVLTLRDISQFQQIKLSPRERFIYFVNNNPELLQRVPQKILASYLNIKPETFSRFKHLLRKPAVRSGG